jgi:hypothetical protein
MGGFRSNLGNVAATLFCFEASAMIVFMTLHNNASSSLLYIKVWDILIYFDCGTLKNYRLFTLIDRSTTKLFLTLRLMVNSE